MRLLPCLAAVAALSLVARHVSAQGKPLAPSDVPNPLGVNIHFTDPRPGEMDMLARGGFRWVRMDFGWHAIERVKGRYDFSAYDRLMSALVPHHIRAIFILDYSNPLYDDNMSPHTEEGRAAMARWAAAAATHFKGRGVVWEMYNEPNIGFWRPKPNVDDYVKLALAVGKAVRAASPNEIYAGPATSTIEFGFLETCFKAGLLQYWDAVTVHPYRQTDPETAEEEYRRLRLLIVKYAPKGKTIPIVSGEWGYSAGWKGMDEAKQARMLAREYLVNLANDIPISIWYDWHDDGKDPKEPEHHFGTVHNPYREGVPQVYEPKPAYLAARTVANALSGFRFNKRLWTGSPDDYVLLFSRGADVRIAAWTRSTDAHDVRIAASPGRFTVTSCRGERLPDITAESAGLPVRLTGSPLYLAPTGPNPALRKLAEWRRLPLEYPISAPAVVTVANPARLPERINISRGSSRAEIITFLKIGGATATQRSEVVVLNPLLVQPLAPAASSLPVRVSNPSGERVEVDILAHGPPGSGWSGKAAVSMPAGRTETIVNFPLPTDADSSISLAVVEHGAKPPADELDWTQARVRAVAVSDLAVTADGDSQVPSEQTVSQVTAPEGLPSPYGSPQAWRIDYRFDPGWKFLEVRPKAPAPIEGNPKRFSVWLHGDGRGNIPRLRFTDSAGQTFQPDGESIKWTGWRWVEFPMDGTRAGHWGGPNDGVIRYPIRWDSLFLLDSATRNRTSGTIYLFGATLFY